jgi:site-specific DNA-methyltransferase (adenine-specific)
MQPTQIGNATLFLGDAFDILPHLSEVDHCITDPPYGEQTQKNARLTGPHDGGTTHYIDFHIDESDVRRAFDIVGRITRRWVIASMEFRHAAVFEKNPPENLRFVRVGCWVKPSPSSSQHREIQVFLTSRPRQVPSVQRAILKTAM